MDRIKTRNNTYFVIMAGGVGSRFWPASKESLPKQFLDILGTGRSLIQMTYDRIQGLVPPEQIIVVTHEKYGEQVQEHLPDLPLENILQEPCRKNTGPCVAYVSFHILARHQDANMVILPADHLITKEQSFHTTVKESLKYVTVHPVILTLGMKPHRPNTGYGYIQLGKATDSDAIYKVEAFKEKPSQNTAQEYLKSGNYMWNAGIFISRADTMVAAFQNHAPEIYRVLHAPKVYGTTDEIPFVQSRYDRSPSISIDFAIMEKANNIVCYVVDIGWSDVGTWKSLYELMRREESSVVINKKADDYSISESHSLMVHVPENKKVVIRGLKDMLVVDTKDILMIWPLHEEQEIKAIKDTLGTQWDMET